MPWRSADVSNIVVSAKGHASPTGRTPGMTFRRLSSRPRPSPNQKQTCWQLRISEPEMGPRAVFHAENYPLAENGTEHACSGWRTHVQECIRGDGCGGRHAQKGEMSSAFITTSECWRKRSRIISMEANPDGIRAKQNGDYYTVERKPGNGPLGRSAPKRSIS